VLNRHKKLNKKECESIIPSLLEDVELESSIALRYPHELSGGQKQRAAIALSLACEPSLLFADEPTTALDVVTQSGILRLLVKLQKERNLTIVLVTHDLPMASSVCNSLYVMKGGCMVESGKSSDVIHSPREDYTKSLVKAMLFR
ncbi:MAG: ATP-binding cassette domain-containing protein, partial [Synergistaceae bacterium]